MKYKAKLAVRLFEIALFVGILLLSDTRELLKVVRRTDLRLLAAAFLLLIPLYLFKALRWKNILDAQTIAYSRRNSFLAYLGANFIAFITPGRLGEAVKAFYLRNDTGISLAAALPSVILDRVFDVYFLTIFAAFGMLRASLFDKASVPAVIVMGAVCCAPILFFSTFSLRACKALIKKSALMKRWEINLDEFFDGFSRIHPRNLTIPALLTASAYGVLFSACAVIAQAAEIRIGFFDLAAFVSIANILSFLPVSIAGIGTREACFLYLFSTVGRQKEEALAFSLLFFLIFYIGGGLVGLLAYWIKPVDFRVSRRP